MYIFFIYIILYVILHILLYIILYIILYTIYTLFLHYILYHRGSKGTFIVICYMSYMTFMRLFPLIMDGYPCQMQPARYTGDPVKKTGKKRPKIPAFSEFHDRLSCHRAKQKANNKTQKPNKTHKKHPTPKTSTAGESADQFTGI